MVKVFALPWDKMDDEHTEARHVLILLQVLSVMTRRYVRVTLKNI
jgi:hypothetical protein